LIRIMINDKYCKGCGICIEMCPRGVLQFSEKINEKGYHIPYPKNLEKCIACHQCEMYCPDQAITVVEEKEE